MARRYSYADALKILGEGDSEILDLSEKLADGGLGALGVPDMFGLREKLVGKGRKALEGLGEKVRGQSRTSRTEKILAAHQILVVVAFFEAVEEEARRTGSPLSLEDLEFTKDEQWDLVDRIVDRHYTPREPSAVLSPFRATKLTEALGHEFFGEIAANFQMFVTGLACVERLGITSASHETLNKWMAEVTELSVSRYEEYSLRLAAEVPEFGMWIHVAEHAQTRAHIGTGLTLLRELLDALDSGRPVAQKQRELATLHAKALSRPMLSGNQAPPHVRLPTLESGYVPPRGRINFLSARRESSPSSDAWWDGIPVRDNLEEFFAAHLVHPHATTYPTVVLGHPGSGKSTFTEVLAAQLPASDFPTVRVELRSVPADASVPTQIEKWLHESLHEQVSWRELLDSADGALPVIILDGFDELLQASGVDRSHYLESVQEFQERQEAMGQPVVVIVTSRTVVTDRMRFPDGTTVVRLEPFDTAQIEQLLRVWNRGNSGLLSERNLRPLTSDIVLRYQDLAEQPLLLMMLLLYDADGNALRHAAETFSHSELYERLLTMFAEREVEKLQPHLGPDDHGHAVEGELRLLEIAALAMFTRRRQNVDADTLSNDLAVLAPQESPTGGGSGRHGRLSPAHKLLGRFFFVHEDRAVHTDGTASVFEFLHATFGEYLVARAVVTALEDLVDERSLSYRRRRGLGSGAPLDDGELYAYSSFTCYAGREKIVPFLSELLGTRLTTETRALWSDLLVELYREAPFPASNRSLADYEPTRLPLTQRQANYTANLVILLTLVSEDPVDVRSLHPDAEAPLREWRATANLWSTLPGTEWDSIQSTLRMRHRQTAEATKLISTLELENHDPVDVGECIGFRFRHETDMRPDTNIPYGLTVPYESHSSQMLRGTSLRVSGTAARLFFDLLPYLRHINTDLRSVSHWVIDKSEHVWTEPHAFLQLLLVPIHEAPDARLEAYLDLLSGSLDRPQLLALRQAAKDLANTSEDFFDYHTLQDCVWHYLNDLRVVVLPASDRAELDSVLRALSETTAFEDREGVLALLDKPTEPPEA